MSDLISRATLLKELRQEQRECEKDGEEFGGESILFAEAFGDIIEMVKRMPAVDAVPAAEHDMLVRRLQHLLDSDYICSFDERDFRTGEYKRDIREATAPVVHARWAVTFAPESTALTPIAYCTACKRASTTWSDGLEKEIRYCFFCGAKMDGGDTDG